MIKVSLFLFLLATPGLGAQARIRGIVSDSSGNPVGGATVAVVSLNRAVETDAAGKFYLTNVTPGMRIVSVRRIGFSAFSMLTEVVDGENEFPSVILSRVATRLDTVITEEKMLWREAPLLREFEENRKIGLGKFFTREDLEKARGRSMMSFFESMPGFRTVELNGGRWIKATRTQSVNGICYELEDRIGGLSPPGINCGCFPLVYLDFQQLSMGGLVPNINRFRPDDLEAMEVYRNAAQTPPRYGGLGSQCGVIVLHSRRPIGKKDR